MEDKQRRYTVSEAARVLGTTEAAIRARINRGKLPSEKIDNTVYVRLDADSTLINPTDQAALVEALRDQIDTLKHQLNTEQEASAELRRIIAGLIQRVPELEPVKESPSEPQESAENARESDAPPRADAPREEDTDLPWWRRWFS